MKRWFMALAACAGVHHAVKLGRRREESLRLMDAHTATGALHAGERH